MAIISCPSCGSSVSSEAISCPKCNTSMTRHGVAFTTSNSGNSTTQFAGPQSIPTIGDWIINFLLLSIPLVNFIILIVWAVDSNNPIRKNFAAAALMWMVILFFFFIIFWSAIIAALL